MAGVTVNEVQVGTNGLLGFATGYGSMYQNASIPTAGGGR